MSDRDEEAGAPEASMEPVHEAIAALTAIHEQDPRRRTIDGVPRPVEAVWTESVERWIDVRAPQASAALRIAAHAQHLERWMRPRDAFPAGRAGYLRWRREAGVGAAERAREVCLGCGCSEALSDRVAALVRKERLADDAETLALEDAACLAFVELDLEAFAARHAHEDVLRILARTWRKMSVEGRALLGRAAPGAQARALLEAALGAPD